MLRPDPSAEGTDLAAAETARIGGSPNGEGSPAEERDEAQCPLAEGGEGQAEGFEQAEHQLIENASHGDQHAARRVIEGARPEQDDARAARQGDPDYERSSERERDTP